MSAKKVNYLSLSSIFIILLSALYALFLLPSSIVFGYDQARDAYEAYSIWQEHNPKILGPSSDIPGINHGVLWYYFLAIIYGLGNGLPENAVKIMLFGLYATLPLMWYFTQKMSKDRTVTALSTALYAMSPLFIAFTLWLSNPTLALFVTPPLFYFVWLYLQKQKALTAFFIGLFYALLIQTDFAFIVMMFSLPIYFFVFRLRFSIPHIAVFIGGWLIGMASFFITYIKFQTNIVGIIAHFLSTSSGKDLPVGQTAMGLIDSIVRLFHFTYVPLPAMITFFLLLTIGIYFRKTLFSKQDALSKHLFIWFTGLFFIFIFNRGAMPHTFFFAPFLYPLAIFMMIALVKLIKDWRVLAVAILVITLLQISVTHTWLTKIGSPLSVQKGMTTNYERAALDYIYQSANNQPFAISTITNPLWINTTWAYLFTMYGKPTYGYVPYLWGKDQTGRLGELPMQTDLKSPTQRYLIIEPPEGIDKVWIIKGIYDEDLISDIVEEKKFGGFTVQKRVLHLDKGFVATPAALLERK